MRASFIQKKGLLYSLDPRTKIVMIVVFTIVGFIDPDPSHLLISIGVLALIAITSSLTVEFLKMVSTFSILTIFIVIFSGFLGTRGGPIILAVTENIGMSYGNLEYAARIVFRLYVICFAACLVVMSTHPCDLAKGLIKWKVPYSGAFMVLTTFQLIPILQREANVIIEAQQSRGLETKGNVINRIKTLVPVCTPLFIVSFVKVNTLAEVMECRGFSREGEKTSFREVAMGAMDYVYILFLVFYLCVCIYARFQVRSFLTSQMLIGVVILTVGLFAYQIIAVCARMIRKRMIIKRGIESARQYD